MAKNKKKNKKIKKQKISFSFILLLFVFMALCLLYLPMAILFVVSMLPTIVAYFTDSIEGKNKTFTIGALNFSAFFYYFINIWRQPFPMDVATEYLANPITIIVIYAAAALGYGLNYIFTLLVSGILKQKSLARIDKLEDQKKKLEERWGEKVNGKRELDRFGFIRVQESSNQEE
jgi:hypothetical protein